MKEISELLNGNESPLVLGMDEPGPSLNMGNKHLGNVMDLFGIHGPLSL